MHLFTQGLNSQDVGDLRATAGRFGERLQFHEAKLELFQSFKSLQGDWMTYQRLLLPELLPQHDVILYLDADLVLEGFDVLQFQKVDVTQAPFAAGAVGSVRHALEGSFYRSLGMSDDDRAFNAGVLLINARWWREHDVTAATLAFGHAHSASLASADQTILNALYSRQFVELPPNYNLAMPCDQAVLAKTAQGAILHFVGSPKPWDFGGQIWHRNCHYWSRQIKQTQFHWLHFLRRNWLEQLTREWTIRRSYFRLFSRILRRN